MPKDRSKEWDDLNKDKELVKALLIEGISCAEVARKFEVKPYFVHRFRDENNITKKGFNHPAVSHLEVVPLYKLAQGIKDRNNDYLIETPNYELKVYIDISEYIRLKKQAELTNENI